MKHFIYKTTHINGKYYIGRHSTENIDDGYFGSGKWPRSIKDKSELTREILEYTDSIEHLKILEASYLKVHYNNDNCMNMTIDPVGFDSTNNPMHNPDIVNKISGVNHWTSDSIKAKEKLAGDAHWMNKNPDAKTRFIKNNPNLDGRNSKLASSRGRNIFQTNNPSKKRSKDGLHHWQNGNSPNSNGKLNKKLIESGTHNFLGPNTNNNRISDGTHNFLGPSLNLKLLSEGKHPSQKTEMCDHCGRTFSIGMHKRWHGDKCKHKPG
jgi:hypothetical protein